MNDAGMAQVRAFAAPAFTRTAGGVPRGPAYGDHHAAGFHEGYTDGLARARAEVDAAIAEQARAAADHAAAAARLEAQALRLAAAAQALETAAADFRTRETQAAREMEAAVAQLAVELTALTLQRELAAPDAVLESLRRAAPLAPDRETPTVRVHPDAVGVVEEHLGQAASLFTSARVVADPAVDRIGCVIDVGACRIDAQLSTALARLRALTASA